MLEIYSGVDGGNDASKIVTWSNGVEDKVLVPNVVRMVKRDRSRIMKDGIPEEEMDVEITSDALADGRVHALVGKLAVRNTDNKEMKKLSNKALDDQPLIVILTGLAYQAAKMSDDMTVVANYKVGTGLPVADVKEYRETFRNRIQGTHEVVFRSTPGWENRKVRLEISFVDVSVEGGAALLNLISDMSLSEELMVPLDFEEDEYYFAGGDLGALSMDVPVIRVQMADNGIPKFILDEEVTHGEGFGSATYLDNIISEVWTKHHAKIPSRQALSQILKRERSKWTVPVKGQEVSIAPIADVHLNDLATRAFEAIEDAWEATPSLRRMYMIGGGPLLIRPYLTQLNAKAQYPLLWVPRSEWRTALGYLDNVLPPELD